MPLDFIICQKKVGYENLFDAFKDLEDMLGSSKYDSNENRSLLILPELWISGFNRDRLSYFSQYKDEILRRLKKFSYKHRSYIAVTLVELSENKNNKYINTFFVIDPDGRILARYSKMHLFPLTGEQTIFEKGHSPTIVEIENVKIGLSICYDIRFPELFRYYARNNVDAVIVSACFPQPREAHWDILLQARSVENQFYVIGVNAVGQDKVLGETLNYFGNSRIVSPLGETLRLLGGEEAIVLQHIDEREARNYRKKIHFIKDERSLYA